MQKEKRSKKILMLLLAFLMVTTGIIPSGLANQSYAATLNGTITDATEIDVGGSTTWGFEVRDGDGITAVGTCMEPDNQSIPWPGDSATMTKLSASSDIAKVAYLYRNQASTNVGKYVIGHAAAYLAGNVAYNRYTHYEEVNNLVERAKAAGDVPSSFEVFRVKTEGGKQEFIAWREAPTGKVTLIKSASVASVLSQYPDEYSLAGAVYGVFKTRAAAQAGTGRVAHFTTKENGHADEIELDAGTYYVKETTASKGFELDTTIHEVTVTAGGSATVRSTEVPYGHVTLKKSVAKNKTLTDQCPDNYSLAGAVYGVYRSEADARNETDRVGRLTTKANGETNELKVKRGTYYVKELTPSKGFALDPTIHQVTVTAGATATVQSKETPLFDPLAVLLRKLDAGGEGKGPGLADAEFTIKYYSEITDDVSGLSPKKTWVFKTDATGVVVLKDEYKTSGDDLYKDENGKPVGLIGTYVIQETKAPKGYILNDEVYIRHLEYAAGALKTYNAPEIPEDRKVFRVTVTKQDEDLKTNTAQGDATLAGGVFGLYRDDTLLKEYTTDAKGSFTTDYYTIGDGDHVYTVKEITPPEGYVLNDTVYTVNGLDPEPIKVQYTTVEQEVTDRVIKGKIAITKIYDAQDETELERPEEGVTFEVYLKSAGSFDAANERERDTITTDAQGDAITKDLPYGVYVVHQKNSIPGHGIVKDFEVRITKDGGTYHYIINNAILKADIQVVKIDAETDKTIPVAGVRFKIKNEDSGEWVGFEMRYPHTYILDEFLTDEDGQFHLPDRLEYGQYALYEQAAPEGYVLSKDPVPFEVDGSQEAVGIRVPNKPQKGVVDIFKTGEVLKTVKKNTDGSYTPVYGQGGLEGAEFTIYADKIISTPDRTVRYNEGDEVAVVTTGADGHAKSPELYLGEYRIVETKAPFGYQLDETEHHISIEYAGQDVEVIQLTDTFTDTRMKAILKLRKALDESTAFEPDADTLANVKFGLFAQEEITARDGTNIPADGRLETKAAAKNGVIRFDADVPAGAKLYAKELATDPHYVLDETEYPLVFDAEKDVPEVEIWANDGKAIENDLIFGKIHGLKVDSVSVDPIQGAVFGLFAPDTEDYTLQNAIFSDTTDADGTFAFEEVPVGKWTIAEIQPAPGYLANAATWSVEIGEQDQVIELTIENDKEPKLHTSATGGDGQKEVPAKGEITITDVVTYEDLVPGKEYVLEGTLMNKGTGEPFLDHGKTVTAKATFTPTTPNGSVTMTFTFDGSSVFKTTDVVVFEDLYRDDVLVGIHADINDKDQTVRVKVNAGWARFFFHGDKLDTHVSGVGPATGDTTQIATYLLLLCAAVLGFVITAIFARREKKRE